MTLEVIGAGFGRTGTMTLKIALETLGFQRCYHMIEVIRSPSKVAKTWLAALDGHTTNWEEVFRGFSAAVDWPTTYFLPELIERYPNAKVILTERDADSWYNSAQKTIFRAIQHSHYAWVPAHQKLSHELIINRTFKGNVANKEHAISIYKQHIKWVKTHVPQQRLIHLDLTQGWKGLCKPLNRPVPDAPFPHTNTQQEFQQRFIAT